MPLPSPASLQEALGRHHVPGAVLGVLDGDEIVEIAAGVTNADTRQPVTPATPFRIASITKVFTATLVMQLVDEGSLDLDAPVRRYLPDLRLKGADDEVVERILVRHLLTHTSGIPGDWYPDFGEGDDCFAELVASLARVELLHPPGYLYSYGNSGFVVLGQIVQEVTGRTWEENIVSRISEPLGLGSVEPLLSADAPARPDVAVSHAFDPVTRGVRVGEMWPEYRTPAPAGSTLIGTARDVLRFAAAHLNRGVGDNGARLLSAKATAAMQVPQVEQPTVGSRVGLAWMISDPEARTIGHAGGTSNFLRAVPEEKFAVLLLTNSPFGGMLYREVVAPIFTERFGIQAIPTLPAPPAEPPRFDAPKLTGEYAHARIVVSVTERRGVLALNGRALRPLSDSVFVPANGDPLSGLVTFVDGQYLHTGGMVYRRTA